MTRWSPAHALAGLLAVALAGCGITNPYQTPSPKTPTPTRSSTTSTSTTTAADAQDPRGERGGRIPTATQAGQGNLAPGAGQPTPQRALDRYAHLYVNWHASDLVAHQRTLAAISLDQARAQALQAAASSAKDPELTRSQVTNCGQLVAITRGQGAAAGRWVLVTRERTTGQGRYAGLPPTLHVTYATAIHAPLGWVITTWAPQT